MIAKTITLPLAGQMGAGHGAELRAHGARALTRLDRRSPATLRRAEATGMNPAGMEAIAGANIILSVVAPALTTDRSMNPGRSQK